MDPQWTFYEGEWCMVHIYISPPLDNITPLHNSVFRHSDSRETLILSNNPAEDLVQGFKHSLILLQNKEKPQVISEYFMWPKIF